MKRERNPEVAATLAAEGAAGGAVTGIEVAPRLPWLLPVVVAILVAVVGLVVWAGLLSQEAEEPLRASVTGTVPDWKDVLMEEAQSSGGTQSSGATEYTGDWKDSIGR